MLPIKCQKLVKNDSYDLPEVSEVTSSNVLFCPTNSPKHKDIQFSIMSEKEASNIFWHNSLKNDQNNYSVIKVVANEFSVDQPID